MTPANPKNSSEKIGPASATATTATATASAPASSAAIRVDGLSFSYGEREVLRNLSLSVCGGELYGLLGPNGSGKSTLLRLLSTVLRAPPDRLWIDGLDPARDSDAVRRRIGVAFQSPSLDVKLSVEENIRFQGYLFGLRGKVLASRIGKVLEQFGLSGRRNERVETLSGGLRRRVELAKTLLHEPPVLLLDEPSTGLDPAARLEFWSTLHNLRREERLTILVATHLMDEAERCDRVALIDEGRLVAAGTPAELKHALGGEVLTLEASDPQGLVAALRESMGIEAEAVDGMVRLAEGTQREVLTRAMQKFPDEIQAMHVGKPTLEDVFIARTGHRFAELKQE